MRWREFQQMFVVLGGAMLCVACHGKSSRSGRARATPPAPPATPDTGPAEPQLSGAPIAKPTVDMTSTLRFTPDGKQLLALDRSVSVYAFDHEHGTLRASGWFGFEVDQSVPDTGDLGKLQAWLDVHEAIRDFDVSADGRFVVGGGGRSGRLAVWALTPGEAQPARMIADVQAPLREIDVVRFARGGTRIVAGGRTPDESSTAAEDTVFTLFSFDGKTVAAIDSVPAGQRLEAMAISPDGTLAAVVGSNRFFRMLDVGEEKLSVVFDMEAEDDLDDVRFSPDGQSLITAGSDQTVRVWDVARKPAGVRLRQVLRHHQARTRQVQIAPDGRWMAVAGDDHQVSFWPLAGLRADASVTPIVITPSTEDVTYGMAIHPSWPWLVTAGDSLRVWRLNRDALATGAASVPRKASAARALPWSGPPAVLATFRAGGELLTVDSAGAVVVWDLTADPPAARVVRAGEAMPEKDFGPVGDAALAGESVLLAHGDTLLVVALADGAVQTIDVPASSVAVAGECVLTGRPDGSAGLWRLAAGGPPAPVAMLPAHAERVRAVALLPSLALVSGQTGANTALHVDPIDAATCAPMGEGELLFAPPTPFGNVNHTGSNPDGQETPIAMAFSADGRWLLSGGRDGGSATLWSVEGAKVTQRAFLAGHQYGVFAVGWAPDGKRAITGGSGGTTLLWQFDAGNGTATRVEDLPPPATGAGGFPETVAWSADGTRVCVGGGHYHDGRVWCYTLTP